MYNLSSLFGEGSSYVGCDKELHTFPEDLFFTILIEKFMQEASWLNANSICEYLHCIDLMYCIV